MIAEDMTVIRFPTKAWKIMNVQKHEEEKMKIQASDLELPLCLQILNDAISYFKEENKRCSEMDNQPLLKDFISGDGPLLKREEKKLHLWRENDHIPNRRFSDTKQLRCRRSKLCNSESKNFTVGLFV
ncbi:hypothetical protein Bca52824_010761 [Brassica carinata]|uniref:HHO5-like N-terminal domain-containing protein n=1 Tax=Brassica carinata TaxID=52824 RepID=A0A8X7WGN8_BRACI|nr:hypothetical protein Bca52824_010761 [Brassica carinata]